MWGWQPILMLRKPLGSGSGSGSTAGLRSGTSSPAFASPASNASAAGRAPAPFPFPFDGHGGVHDPSWCTVDCPAAGGGCHPSAGCSGAQALLPAGDVEDLLRTTPLFQVPKLLTAAQGRGARLRSLPPTPATRHQPHCPSLP